MRKYGKWLLVLGILAANPAWVSADGFLSSLRPSSPQSKAAQQEQNQRTAEQVASALKQARLNGYDLEVEVRGDTVKLDGKVRDVTHRVLAENVCRQIPGIERVQNNLRFVPSGNIQQTAGTYTDSALRPATYNVTEGENNDVQQVHFTKPGKRTPSEKQPAAFSQQRVTRPSAAPSSVSRPNSSVQAAQYPDNRMNGASQNLTPASIPPETFAPQAIQTPIVAAPKAPEQRTIELTSTMKPNAPFTSAKPAGASNQETAQNIADSLGEVGLLGYNIEVRYEDGVAKLVGEVANAQQVQAAGFAASRVPGVRSVQNHLKIGGPITQTAFQSSGHPMPPMYPVSMGMAGGMQQGGPTAIAAAGSYSNPQLPSHAWPAYAQYPNSAAVQYPTQYSASAFPYIGPFYPYPQVPLGWREVKLQWDDGYWQLDFEAKKKAWYWLWNPSNW